MFRIKQLDSERPRRRDCERGASTVGSYSTKRFSTCTGDAKDREGRILESRGWTLKGEEQVAKEAGQELSVLGVGKAASGSKQRRWIGLTVLIYYST